MNDLILQSKEQIDAADDAISKAMAEFSQALHSLKLGIELRVSLDIDGEAMVLRWCKFEGAWRFVVMSSIQTMPLTNTPRRVRMLIAGQLHQFVDAIPPQLSWAVAERTGVAEHVTGLIERLKDLK